MFLHRFVRSKTGKILMSVLLGLGLATLFRIACEGKDCVIYKAPPIDKIEDKVYKIDNKCYKFERINQTCSKSKNILEMG